MATTTNFGIYYPTTATQVTPLSTQFSLLAQSVDDALNAGYWRFGGLDAARVALTGVKLKEGITWYSTDTNREWFYDGTAWLPNQPGQYSVIPTSVSGATVATDGTIIPTTGIAGVITVDGVFSDRFKTYKVMWYYEPQANASATFQFRRAGATPVMTYANQRTHSSGATLAGSITSLAYFDMSTAVGAYHWGELTLFNTRVTAPKAWRGSGSVASPSSALWDIGGIATGSDAPLDGFSFSLSAIQFKAAAQSYIRVYGLL